MLSVLIPSYDISVVTLVNQIYTQLTAISISFEIICLDDASESVYNLENQNINKLNNCSFTVLKKNIGRSSIRNLLALQANYNWLLFLDADVLAVSDNFIKNYIDVIKNTNDTVFLGGIKYREIDGKHLLRWKFGKRNEEVPVLKREKHAYHYFFTANFLINKSIFNSIKFNEKLVNYGYEDLLFAKQLYRKKINVKHLKNEVFHLGIDKNLVFINKTKKGIQNLHYLLKEKLIDKEDTKLSKYYFILNKYKIIYLLAPFLSFFEKKAINISSVFYYNLFKISFLHTVFKNSK